MNKEYIKNLVDSYIGDEAFSVKENSTLTKSVSAMNSHIFSDIVSNYWLDEIYTSEIAEAHRNRTIHLHDLGHLGAYCQGHSLPQLIREGIVSVNGKTASAPAKHLSTMINQMAAFIGIMSNEFAGAQAYNSVDTLLAPFVREDNLTYEEVKDSIQSFIFQLNQPTRWSQAPFSNISLDVNIPEDLAKQPAVVGGKFLDYTYAECQKEADMINKAILEVLIEGDGDGRILSYPVVTFSISKEFDWSETELNELLFTYTAKFGGPYFANYVNSKLDPRDIRSLCCRLSLDLQEIRENGGGGYFGAADSTGSIGVVTLNLPQLAYKSKTEEEFFSELDRLIDLAALSLDLKRKKINELLTKGLYPYTSRYLGHFNNHFSTIGINGMNEAILNADWLEGNIAKEENKQWAIKVVYHIRHRLPELQQKHNQLFNLEATPAESTAYRFAKHDKANYPNIITAGDTTPYYTNSTHLPVGYTEDIFTAMKHQSDIATLYNGGTVFHAFLAQEIPDWKTAMKLTKYIAYNTELSYFSLTPTFSICRNHGYISGKHFECPTCGEKTEVYSRITGYYRPLQNWNDGKVEEFKDRQEYEYKARIENFE